MGNEDLLAMEARFLGMNVGRAAADPDFLDPQQFLPYNATGLDSPSISMPKDISTNVRKRSTARRRKGEEEETVGPVRKPRSCHRMTPEEFKYSHKDNLNAVQKGGNNEVQNGGHEEVPNGNEEVRKEGNEEVRKWESAEDEACGWFPEKRGEKEQKSDNKHKQRESTEFREKEQQQNAKQQSEKRKDPLVLIRDRANARASVYPCNLVILMNKHIPQLFFFSENKFLYSENIFWLGEGGLGAELPLYAKGWCFHCPQNIDWRVHFPLLITSNVDLF